MDNELESRWRALLRLLLHVISPTFASADVSDDSPCFRM
jgi:hypothetical protein